MDTCRNCEKRDGTHHGLCSKCYVLCLNKLEETRQKISDGHELTVEEKRVVKNLGLAFGPTIAGNFAYWTLVRACHADSSVAKSFRALMGLKENRSMNLSEHMVCSIGHAYSVMGHYDPTISEFKAVLTAESNDPKIITGVIVRTKQELIDVRKEAASSWGDKNLDQFESVSKLIDSLLGNLDAYLKKINA